ncbi:hypothetical protein EHS25_007704 [Saitozyma podzolica]|uniref:Trimethylguanosine synthase n=1 Tax=Saitozyma podzolica TaxID=1890683 RepID=A0A427YQG3_9TREE|nr:hypothetical protein EHS25_007704 [Saitozyma podzolica]
MPRSSRPSRSLFAALPVELKRSIRTQTLDSLAVKKEMLSEALDGGRDNHAGSKSDLLPTQPPLLSGNGQIYETYEPLEEEEANNLGAVVTPAPALPAAVDQVVPVVPDSANDESQENSVAESSASAQKRRYEAIVAMTRGEVGEVESPTRDSYGWSGKKKRSQRPPNKGPKNPYLGHPWDCTGLVPRYAHAEQVPKDLKKYFAQRHLYFPQYDRLPLLLDHTGWFSITPYPIAKHIAERCRCDVIIDAFCGVGGNTIEFAQTCERVIAIDSDLTRLRLARHNALQLGVADRIEFIHGDYVDFARSYASRAGAEAIDVVFLSPPWGGMEYLTFSTETTQTEAPPPDNTYSLDHILPIPGDELFEITSALTPNIAYYLPRNVDVDALGRLAPKLEPAEMGGDAEAGGDARRDREWVEIEEEWVGDKLKAVTAYFGGLVAE